MYAPQLPPFWSTHIEGLLNYSWVTVHSIPRREQPKETHWQCQCMPWPLYHWLTISTPLPMPNKCGMRTTPQLLALLMLFISGVQLYHMPGEVPRHDHQTQCWWHWVPLLPPWPAQSQGLLQGEQHAPWTCAHGVRGEAVNCLSPNLPVHNYISLSIRRGWLRLKRCLSLQWCPSCQFTDCPKDSMGTVGMLSTCLRMLPPLPNTCHAFLQNWMWSLWERKELTRAIVTSESDVQ